MLGRRTIAVALALAAICSMSLVAPALAGKKKKTVVVVNAQPVLVGPANVKVTGSLNTTSGCKPSRDMRLFLTDSAGNIEATIDSATSKSGGTWKLQAKLTAAPNADQRLQVKAKKRTAGKYVCKAGVSGLLAIEGGAKSG